MRRTSAIIGFVAALGVMPAPLAAQAPTQSDPRDVNLTAYVELLRSDVQAQKVAILTELMDLTEAQDTAFWPIYREYNAELAKVNDERVAMIKEYAANFGSVTDAVADSLARKAIDTERRRTELLEKYYERVKTALSARTAARFLQIEHQMLLLIDLQIAASLPVVD
jgi:hypothetical protein